MLVFQVYQILNVYIMPSLFLRHHKQLLTCYTSCSDAKPGQQNLPEELEDDVKEPPYGAMVGQMKDFIDAIVEDREPYITGESVRPQVEITRGIYKSVATGQPTKLPMKPYDPFYGD